MILNRSKYEVISYTGKEEFPVVGDITMQGKEFCSAEVIDTWITNVDEVERLREFLDIVEKKMQYSESCKNDIPTMATHTGSTTTDEALYQLMQNTANEDTKIDQTRYKKPPWAVSQIVRASGLVENLCCHGCGHPHPASVAEFEERGIMCMGIHGCDGCCCDKEHVQSDMEDK